MEVIKIFCILILFIGLIAIITGLEYIAYNPTKRKIRTLLGHADNLSLKEIKVYATNLIFKFSNRDFTWRNGYSIIFYHDETLTNKMSWNFPYAEVECGNNIKLYYGIDRNRIFKAQLVFNKNIDSYIYMGYVCGIDVKRMINNKNILSAEEKDNIVNNYINFILEDLL